MMNLEQAKKALIKKLDTMSLRRAEQESGVNHSAIARFASGERGLSAENLELLSKWLEKDD